MLPGHRRIRRAEQFRAVIRSGSRASARTVVVHIGGLPGEGPIPRGLGEVGPARAGFVVGRSVGGSVIRHRVLRRLRHLMAQQLASVPDGSGVVVRALPASAVVSFDVLERDLSSAVLRCLTALGQVPASDRVVSP